MAHAPKNYLLQRLDIDRLRRIIDLCRPLKVKRGDVLLEAGREITAVYFPETAVVSAISNDVGGQSIEMATIGREGCTGVSPSLGATKSLVTYLIQVDGLVAVMDIEDFQAALESEPDFRSLHYAYINAFLHQVMVSGACNGVHLLEQRLARWLLNMRDRAEGDTLPLTQEFLAGMLGAQRPSVSKSAAALQSAGLITYSRGAVTVVDADGLEKRSCECYGIVRNVYEETLPRFEA